jgi:hypothetical protein
MHPKRTSLQRDSKARRFESRSRQREIKQLLRGQCDKAVSVWMLSLFGGLPAFGFLWLFLAAAMRGSGWPWCAIGLVMGLTTVGAVACVHAAARSSCYECNGRDGTGKCCEGHRASRARWVEDGWRTVYLITQPFDFASMYERARGRGPAATEQELLSRCEEATLVYLRFEAEGIADTEDPRAILQRRFDEARALSDAICAWEESKLDRLEQVLVERQRRADALRRAARLNAAEALQVADDDEFLAWLRGDTEALREGWDKALAGGG